MTAWWIAFGPHGPRALAPPGEWTKVWLYTAIGVGISFAVFWGIHLMARPPPRSMTKEWQEATNEYLKVSRLLRMCHYSLTECFPQRCMLTRVCSPRKSTLCMVLAAKDTAGQVMFKARRPSLKVSAWNLLNRWRDRSDKLGAVADRRNCHGPLYCAPDLQEGWFLSYFVSIKIK